MERAAKDPGNHAHILFLKIIPAQPLRQILAGHLLPGMCFYSFCQFLNRHALAA